MVLLAVVLAMENTLQQEQAARLRDEVPLHPAPQADTAEVVTAWDTSATELFPEEMDEFYEIMQHDFGDDEAMADEMHGEALYDY